MSLNAWRQIELERKRKELLRLEHVRTQARALVAACESEVLAVKDPAVQQLSAGGLKSVRQKLQQASLQVDQTPDQALKAVRAAQKHLHSVIAETQAAAYRWSKEQAASKASIDEARARINAQQATANDAGAQVLTQANVKLAEANTLHQQGRYGEATSKSQEADSLIQKAAQATFDETVRREVSRSLLATLQEMGFVVEGPSLRKHDGEPGIVTLEGRLPSGRTARFEIQIDGRLSYDLDGYKDRTCAQQVEQIEQVLKDRFGIKLGPPQVTWKNPDRISKGAHNLPTGTRQARPRQ